ncbi:hypothetical protein [Limosilactobacillus allomucosae]|uniref:hypothetical protein n=1 Tax=Limosilactobacillus allomucosae TaxID=3142938 RepID=UPI0032669A2B
MFEEKQVEATDSHEPSAAAVEKREPSRHPKPEKSNSRKENLDRLPQEDCEYDLDDKTCPDCHQEMKQIGCQLVKGLTLNNNVQATQAVKLLTSIS